MTQQLKPGSDAIRSARIDGDAIVVAVTGEIDLNNSPDLRVALLDLVVQHQPKRMVLNLADVPYMDSSAIAVLVELLQKMRRNSGKVFLVAPQPRVKGLLEIARLDSIFSVVADESAALADCA